LIESAKEAADPAPGLWKNVFHSVAAVDLGAGLEKHALEFVDHGFLSSAELHAIGIDNGDPGQGAEEMREALR
jgi:hypothetical protein